MQAAISLAAERYVISTPKTHAGSGLSSKRKCGSAGDFHLSTIFAERPIRSIIKERRSIPRSGHAVAQRAECELNADRPEKRPQAFQFGIALWRQRAIERVDVQLRLFCERSDPVLQSHTEVRGLTKNNVTV